MRCGSFAVFFGRGGDWLRCLDAYELSSSKWVQGLRGLKVFEKFEKKKPRLSKQSRLLVNNLTF